VKPLVVRLSDLTPGDVGKVVFVSSERGKRLDRLSAMGLTPGTLVKLHQRQPSFILDLGETQLAVDRDIAAEIYVKKMGCSYLK
jgi:DtxR family Mn-dependent transcriptional regulator